MKDKIGYIFCLICILLLMYGRSYANMFNFRHLTVDDGLSSNIVHSIVQDKCGYIWIGTEEGLNRYDGTQTKVYRNGYNGLVNGYINVLFVDSRGQLWIGTDTGIFLYMEKNDSFCHFNKQTADSLYIKQLVTNITEDKEGVVWVSTLGQGVFSYNSKTDLLTQYAFADCSGMANFIYAGHDNTIWVATKQEQYILYKLNRTQNIFEPLKLKYQDEKNPSAVLTLYEDASSTLWMGTWSDGLQKVDKQTGIVTSYLCPDQANGILHIHSITEQSPNVLLIGSDDGLEMFNTLSGKSKSFIYEETNQSSLSDKFVYPIVYDREGGLWVGTYYGGVNYMSPQNNSIEGFSSSRFRNSVSGKIINRFCEDYSGNIWISSDDGGLSRYSPLTGQFSCYMPDKNRNSLSYHNVHSLCFDGDDLWIGTYSGGLNVLNTKTGFFRHYQSFVSKSNSLDGSSIYAILRDRDGEMWVTSMTGVNRYNRATDDFTRVKNLDAMTIDIKQDKTGNLWFATQGKGVFRYNPQKNEWKNYIHTTPEGISSGNVVNCILIDSNDTLWIGTVEGLCKYNAQTDIFESVTLNLPSKNICGIIEDNHVFWLTTSNGLVRYEPGKDCQVFTKNDGLQCNQFIPNAAFKASNGKIYIGSVNGFNSFYPQNISPNNYNPPVVLTGLEISNKKIQIETEGLLIRVLDSLSQLDLSYKQNVISLYFAALSYASPEKNQYAYRLEGFDDDWNYVGNQNKATYTNLPSGTYFFRVKASNNDGLWNEEGASLKIVIHPPFYLTFGFKLLYVLIAISLIVWIIWLLGRRTEKKHQEQLQKLNQEKEKEVYEAKIQFFTMVAHEIRTPVSLIIGPMEKIKLSMNLIPAELSNDLEIIDRNSQRLLSLVNQLLDFRKIEEGLFNLTFSKYSIIPILNSVYERFILYFRQRQIKHSFSYPDTPFSAEVDVEALTKIVSNLLNNAGKYAKSSVEMICMIHPEEQTFEIRVKDDGCGIDLEEQARIFEPFYQVQKNHLSGTGIGLSIVEYLVETHGGTMKLSSEVGMGAEFIVTLPLVQQSAIALNTEEEKQITNNDLSSHFISEKESRPVLSIKSENSPVLLIVEDNVDMLYFLANCFSNEYYVLMAANGLAALEIMKTNEVSMILSDRMMPEMDGITLCKTIRSNQLYSHIPFILLTAKADVDSKVEGMNSGADVYIEKPFSVQYLKACIKNMIELRTLLKQKFSKMPLVPLSSVAGNTVDEEFLLQINNLIEQNFANPDFSVDMLVENLGISRSGFFAKIKTLVDVTPNELIQVVRLKKAAELLLENKYMIKEITYMVGFNTPSYFTKCFQKQFGMKPAEFVQAHVQQKS